MSQPVALSLRRISATTRRPRYSPGPGRRLLTTTAPTSASDAAEQMMRGQQQPATTRRQLLDANQVQKLSLALRRRELHRGLDVSERAPPSGTPLPPGYHLVYFTPVGTEDELGPDGTDRAFNAPAPFTRRMWAGGRMSWTRGCEMRVGDEAEERTRLRSAVAKTGRDGGEMVLVDVEKQFWNEKGLALVDQRSWIFRPESDTASEVAQMPLRDALVRGPSTIEDVEHNDGGYLRRQLRWSPVGLFRFSALTFNGHKIHYDPTWCATVEGHRGCVVHGPLNLINMLDYWRDVCDDGVVREITYRATSPLYAGDNYQIRASNPTELEHTKQWEVLVEKDGKVCMRGSIVS
ncbi:hypothetical protein F5X99DRAFT_366516 [Biscogniauxia marginata]|nr:hypothetical protein F5X99DRAFT_366516 [Biscogniauxia marginata]